MLIIVRCVREEGERAGSVCVSMLDTADPPAFLYPPPCRPSESSNGTRCVTEVSKHPKAVWKW